MSASGENIFMAQKSDSFSNDVVWYVLIIVAVFAAAYFLYKGLKDQIESTSSTTSNNTTTTD